MKKTTLISSALIIASGATLLSACSNDETNDPIEPSSGNRIRFAASTELTRSGDITTNNLNSFNVYAYTGNATAPKIFMDNVLVSKTASNVWTYSPVKYWPAKETVDFYAFAPTSWVGATGPLAPVEYVDQGGVEDIVYAVSPNLSGNTGSANPQVIFNFRHALSKVTVKLSSTNTSLAVRVTNVAMSNITTKGNFHFPGESTATESSDLNTGHWTNQNTPSTYIYHMSQSHDDVILLTTTPNDLSSSDLALGGPKYLIPQPLTWRSSGMGNDTYLAVMCSVYDATTGDKLWPNANTPKENIVEGSTYGDGLLKFPLSTSSFSEWKPGYQYIYNVVINSNEEMGSIDFGTPTVDTYVNITTNYQ